MGNVSDFFAGGGGGDLPGGMTKDPRLLPCFDGTNNCRLYVGSGVNSPGVAAFWTSGINRIGASATTSTDDTYTEVCDITGSGVMFHVVPQAITNTTDDVTFRITVDGIEYVITKTQTWRSSGNPNGRVILGACEGGVTSRYTAVDQYLYDYAFSASPQAFHKDQSIALLPPSDIMTFSYPCLRFEESLKVEVKVTDVDTSIGACGPYCGATYILD